MTIDAADCQNLDGALRLEWLETNGRGGFASGTVAGANTRRYHALLLVARIPPGDRVVLVNHLEEWLEQHGGRTPLSTNLYPGAVHPTGYEACAKFSLDPWPTWTYVVGDVRIQREIFLPHDRDVTVIRWRRLDAGRRRVVLRVRPMLSGRDYHATHHENAVLATGYTEQEGGVCWRPYGDLPPVRAVHRGRYRHDPEWYRRLQLPVEQERGLESEEDWWSPGELSFSLVRGTAATLALTTDGSGSLNTNQLALLERRRRRAMRTAPTGDSFGTRLWSAAQAYVAVRGAGHTVLAGYPWFIDWGRDAFIALPGLCLVTGRYETAWQVIASFAQVISRGMVPNRFPDAGGVPEYNTMDASLWFVHAVERYLIYSGDRARVETIAWPAVQAILAGYREGTRYQIRMDDDGLITGGEAGVQVTWMDAKVGDWVVTPRQGKPVEMQALWIRALSVGESLAELFGQGVVADTCRRDRRRATASFRARFWYEAGGYLYDVIDGPDGDDPSLRPNQLYALALCDELLSGEQARSVVEAVEAHLLTPVGLRTLAPTDPRYQAHYHGGVVQRDGAYHQGTVWPFLLGVFVTAWLRVHGARRAQKTRARGFLNGLAAHLDHACLGQVSEIFDGNAPHEPRGCPAQAWSVAEPLRVLVEELGIGASRTRRKGRR